MSEIENLSNELKLIIFKLGREEYGMDILRVQEIKRMMSITRVPSTPSFIKGVINLRGSVLPVIDLRTRLGLIEGELQDSARIIVVLVNEATVGFIVDEVVEVAEGVHRLPIGERCRGQGDVVAPRQLPDRRRIGGAFEMNVQLDLRHGAEPRRQLR